MNKYQVWVKIGNYQTAHVIMHADNDIQVKMLAEAQYGQGNVLNYTLVYE